MHRRQSATAAGVPVSHLDKAVKLGLVLPGPADNPLGVSGSGRLAAAGSTISNALFGTGSSVDLAALGHLDRGRVDSFSSEEAGSSDGVAEQQRR